jgi:hypothetical protein
MTARCIVCSAYIHFGGRGERLKLMRHCGKEPERLIFGQATQEGTTYLSVKTSKKYRLSDGKFVEITPQSEPAK